MFAGTDPTYKEWKQEEFDAREEIFEERTDPTYKEWKPIEGMVGDKNTQSTDPTYKEWKPEWDIKRMR